MNHVPRHSSVVPARAKAKRAAVTGVATMAAAAGLAIASTGSANAAGSVWDRVAACESGGNWSIATGNGFYGGLQFTRQTWLGFGGGAYAPSAHMASRAQQIAIAQRVLAVQGPGAWPVCSRKAGLTRANGGAAVAVAPASVAVSRSTTRAAIAPKATTARGTVARVQAKVGVKADGVIGRMTVRGIQRYVGVKADGVVGRATVRAIEVKMHLRLTGGSRLTATHIAALAR